jgi:hypothetical protein
LQLAHSVARQTRNTFLVDNMWKIANVGIRLIRRWVSGDAVSMRVASRHESSVKMKDSLCNNLPPIYAALLSYNSAISVHRAF